MLYTSFYKKQFFRFFSLSLNIHSKYFIKSLRIKTVSSPQSMEIDSLLDEAQLAIKETNPSVLFLNKLLFITLTTGQGETEVKNLS